MKKITLYLPNGSIARYEVGKDDVSRISMDDAFSIVYIMREKDKALFTYSGFPFIGQE